MTDPRFHQEGFSKILSHAIEECGEFIAAAGKTQRWGLESYNPLLPISERETNRQWLLREIADVQELMSRLRAELGK